MSQKNESEYLTEKVSLEFQGDDVEPKPMHDLSAGEEAVRNVEVTQNT